MFTLFLRRYSESSISKRKICKLVLPFSVLVSRFYIFGLALCNSGRLLARFMRQGYSGFTCYLGRSHVRDMKYSKESYVLIIVYLLIKNLFKMA